MDGVEPGELELECVGPVELERVVGLRVDVDADDLEPGAVVAHGTSAGAAEQVEQAGAVGRHANRPNAHPTRNARFARGSLAPTRPKVLVEDTAYIIAGQLWDLKGHNVTLEVE